MQSPQDSIQEKILVAYTRALRFLTLRPRSEKEIRDFLVRKNFNTTIVEAVVIKLKNENLTNDEEFAVWWIEQRQEFKGKSKFAISLELSQKGISTEIIERTLNSTDDLATAQALWEKKKRKFEGLPKDEYKKKAYSFLQRKGYRYEIIKKILNEKDSE